MLKFIERHAHLIPLLCIVGILTTFALASIFRPDAIDATAGHDRYGAARVDQQLGIEKC